MNQRTRSDMIEVTYTLIGGNRTRLHFESAETARWALHESRWASSTGKWRPIGTVPVRNLALDVGGARRRETMTDADPWGLLGEIEYAHHLTVWFAVLELEGRGTERINSTPIRERVAELTGEVRTRKSVLISRDRLTKAGVLEATAIDDWRGGYDWRTTERGRRICEAFVREWARVLEIGDTTKSHTADN